MLINGIERDYIIHDANNVKGFFGDYRYLSNFHECPVYFEGLLYPSTENAYQAAKCVDVSQRVAFVDISPKDSKKLGRQINVRKNWEQIKFDVMGIVLLDKFYRNINIRRMLLETGTKYLEETNHWKDRYWGVCDGVGDNNLGRLLMQVRQFYSLLPAGSVHQLF